MIFHFSFFFFSQKVVDIGESPGISQPLPDVENRDDQVDALTLAQMEIDSDD